MTNNISLTKGRDGLFLKLTDCEDGLVAIELEIDKPSNMNKMSLDFLNGAESTGVGDCFVNLNNEQLEALYLALKEVFEK